MFKLFNKKKDSNNKIIFISPDINSGGAENILFNVAKTKSKNLLENLLNEKII